MSGVSVSGRVTEGRVTRVMGERENLPPGWASRTRSGSTRRNFQVREGPLL